MDSRAEILRKIRLGLAKPTPEHHHGHRPEIRDIQTLFASAYRHDALVQTFKREFERVSGELEVCEGSVAVLDKIRELVQSCGINKVAVSDHEICRQLQVAEKLQAEMAEGQVLQEEINSEDSFHRFRLKQQLSQVQLSITGAEYLIADIGAIVVTAGQQASRQISLLPNVHLVLATPEQLYPNMAALFLQIYEKHGENLPGSALTVITGPSRTADIEKVLIRGVHGPNRLLAMICEGLVRG